MYCDNPHLLADRNANHKLSDVYNLFNKWRKANLGVRTGKELFVELEKIYIMMNIRNMEVKHLYKGSIKVKEKERISLAICTPLMARYT